MKNIIYIFFLSLVILGHFQTFAQDKITFYGYVRELNTQELLPGVNIYTADRVFGTYTNSYGFFSLTLPAQTDTLLFSAIGYLPYTYKITSKDSLLTIFLDTDTQNLSEVVIEASQNEAALERSEMSLVSIPIQQIKQIPTLMGEKDVFKALQLMPGVQRNNEINAGLYVRGGGADQNLLILDDAPLYNAFHLFGFLSLFNGDALKSVELTKGGFPARFGGRLSSVVEMQMKDGNKNKFTGEGGVGLISSRLTIEGPLKKDKVSLIVSGRRTYLDVFLAPFMPKSERSRIYFYDTNAKLNWEISKRHKLYLSGYFGRDVFRFNQSDLNQEGFNWGNTTSTLRWNYQISPKVFSNTSLIFSNYDFEVFSTEQGGSGIIDLRYTSRIRDFSFKYDLDYYPAAWYQIKTGALVTHHRFKPNAIVIEDTRVDSLDIQERIIDEPEWGVYIENILRPSPSLRLNLGLRWSKFGSGDGQYTNFEPRALLSYRFAQNTAFKASYALMNQYVHLLSNSGIGLPTDLWVPATDSIPPQRSWQLAVGIHQNLSKANFFLSVEAYYKKMSQIIGYKEGASFLILEVGPDPQEVEQVQWEELVTQGEGWAYGLEFLLQRKKGRLSGWIAYTLSWINHRLDGVNNESKFPARYDRRHDVSIVGIYRWKPNITLSVNWTYATGNAITLPLAKYEANSHQFSQFAFTGGATASDFGERNGFRAPSSHRLDLSIQFHKKKKWGERTWEISVYNAYMRANPFYFESTISNSNTSNNVIVQRSLLPLIPSVSYLFKF